MLCIRFTWQMVKTHVIRLRVIEGPNACDQSAVCAFHTFLVEVQTIAGYMQRMHNNNLEIRIVGSSCRPQLFSQHDWEIWHISYIFKIFFLMSTSFSTMRSSNCWILKSFRLRGVLHSGHAADGRVNRVSTQLSHLSEKNVGQNHLSGRCIREKIPNLLRSLYF